MGKLLKSPGLLRRDPPDALDRKILIAAAVAAARHRRARFRRLLGGISGLAAAVAVAAVVLHHGYRVGTGKAKPAHRSAVAAAARVPAGSEAISEQELLDLSDWTALEQENYNIASQLNCWQDSPDSIAASRV